MFPFWMLLELRMMEVMVTTGDVRSAKLQSKHHHQQTNTQLFYRPDPLPVTQQLCQITEEKLEGNTCEV